MHDIEQAPLPASRPLHFPAAGPYAAVYSVWRTCAVAQQVAVPVWILVVGGAGIVVGLATYGYKIMRVLGVKMTRLTYSRGGPTAACGCWERRA